MKRTMARKWHKARLGVTPTNDFLHKIKCAETEKCVCDRRVETNRLQRVWEQWKTCQICIDAEMFAILPRHIIYSHQFKGFSFVPQDWVPYYILVDQKSPTFSGVIITYLRIFPFRLHWMIQRLYGTWKNLFNDFPRTDNPLWLTGRPRLYPPDK